MAWGRIDENLHSHPKFHIVGPAVSWAYARSISWSNAHGTDGFLPDAIAVDFLPSKRDRVKASTSMLPGKSPLWEPVAGGFMIHDFFEDDRNRPAAWWEELKAKRAASGRAGGESRWAKHGEPPINKRAGKAVPALIPPSDGTSNARTKSLPNNQASNEASASLKSLAKSKPVPVNPPTPKGASPQALATIDQVWAAYREGTGRLTDRDPTSKERARIAVVVKEFGIEKVIAACFGWTHDDWAKRRLNNYPLDLFRDGNLERFAEWHMKPATRPIGVSQRSQQPTVAEINETRRAMVAAESEFKS